MKNAQSDHTKHEIVGATSKQGYRQLSKINPIIERNHAHRERGRTHDNGWFEEDHLSFGNENIGQRLVHWVDVNWTIRRRTQVSFGVGLALILLGMRLESHGFLSFLALIVGMPLFMWLGVSVAFGRWFLQAINYSKSSLFEDYDRHDLTGQRAAPLRWMLGMNRDGSFRP